MSNRIKSALFVDFDNIFIGLKEDDRRAAEEFGRNVAKWLRWIEQEMAVPDSGSSREILVRRCYGNPDTFAPYRGYFTRNAFSVVDCPPLTRSAKNSADIVMVMDILDILGHATRFDEFIIMSADADFTPLVLRLRMHDRRTVAIVAGATAAAYKVSCDLVISDDEFVDYALKIPAPQLQPPRPVSSGQPLARPELLDSIGLRVYEEASASGTFPGARLPSIFREFKEFTPRCNWLGYFSLRALTEAIVSRRPELRLTDDEPWNVAVLVQGAPVGADGAASPVDNGLTELRRQIVEMVRRFVRESPEPVVMARAAQMVTKSLGHRVLQSRWAGAGTFRDLLEADSDLGLTMTLSVQPGYLFDASLHEPPSAGRGEGFDGIADDLAAFIRRISDVTGVPRLRPAQYGILFDVIAKEVARAPYELNTTSKIVRDQMLERGEAVSRQYTSFVLRGIAFTGYHFRGTGVDEAPKLAEAFRGNVLNLLRSAQVTLDEEELALLDEWLLATNTEARERLTLYPDGEPQTCSGRDEQTSQTVEQPLGV